MSQRMPPLNPLRVFDVAARSASFTEAALELSVTQTAVSRQISVLEGYFGIKLFDRDQRTLTLTPEGKRLHREIAPAFEAIGWAASEIHRQSDRNIVTIQTYPTLTAQLLLGRLPGFLEQNPGLSVNFATAVKPADFSIEDSDIVIRVGPILPDGLEGFSIAGDEVAPAVSPALFERSGNDPERLLAENRLLVAKYRYSDWTEWAQAADVDIKSARIMNFDSSHLSYRAAAEGVGICAGQLFLIADDLAAGRLVLPFDTTLSRPLHYWCIWSSHKRMTKQIRTTLDWLKGLGSEVGTPAIRSAPS